MSYFEGLDGGERATNNVAYYQALGLNVPGAISAGISIGTPASGSGYTKPFFEPYSGNAGLCGYYAPPAMSLSSFYNCQRLYIPASSNGGVIAFYNVNLNAQVRLLFNANGSISVYAGGTCANSNTGGTLLGTTAANVFSYGQVFFLGTTIVISATAGAVQLYINGNTASPVLSLTNVDTVFDTTSLPITGIGFNTVCFRDVAFLANTGTAPFNAPIPIGGCEFMYPAANVAGSVAFTPNGKTSNYQNVSLLPPNPTVDYNSSQTVGASDSFTLTPLSSDAVSVFAARSFTLRYKTDSGARASQTSITAGGATSAGTEVYLNETPTMDQDPWLFAPPAGGANWTPTSLNAATLSYDVAA